MPPTWPLITADTPYRPESIYGCTKVWGEVLAPLLCRHLRHIHALCAYMRSATGRTCLRAWKTPGGFSDWASPRDAVQILDKCLEAPPDLKFALLFLQGDNKWGYRDIEHARKVVGFVPQDAAEDYR